jgi:hypothetical protein
LGQFGHKFFQTCALLLLLCGFMILPSSFGQSRCCGHSFVPHHSCDILQGLFVPGEHIVALLLHPEERQLRLTTMELEQQVQLYVSEQWVGMHARLLEPVTLNIAHLFSRHFLALKAWLLSW